MINSKISAQAEASNALNYKGEVRITLRRGDLSYSYDLENEGTKHLLDTITRALAGESIQGNTPKYLDILHGDYDISKQSSCLMSPILLSGITWGEAAEAATNEGRLLVNASVTHEDKKAIAKLSRPRLALKDASGKIIATISNHTAIQQMWESVDDGAEALVAWSLVFSNKVKEKIEK